MKKRLAFLLAIAAAASFFAFRQPARSEKIDSSQNQTQNLSELKPQSVQAVAFGVSPKISSLKDARQAVENPQQREVRFVSENLIPRPAAGVHDADRNLASILPAPMPLPALSFPGLTNRMNGEIFGFYFLPSDTNGDVGLTQYVQTVNTLTRVYDKTGNPLTPPFKMSDIF